MTAVFTDPRIFNYVIMTLYVLNAVRWAFAGGWADCGYWLGAFWITLVVTIGYQR